MNARTIDRVVAVAAAVFAHGAFALAIASMAVALATGLQSGLSTTRGAAAIAVDLLLVLQFPLLHSWLLSRRGSRLLPRGRGGKLGTTFYAAIASLQLLSTFLCWSSSDIVWHRPHGLGGALQWTMFVGAWGFLLKALADAGLALQTGAAGWLALWRGRPVDYGGMPQRGLFTICRQPIYLGFLAVLWCAPVWSPDWLVLAVSWGSYCILGPLHKEARWRRGYRERFENYQASVPYMLPRIRR